MPATHAPSLQPMTATRRALIGAAIGVVVAGALSLARGTDALEGLERRFVDVRTRAYVGSAAPDPRIVLAVVGDSDVDAFKQSSHVSWPWPLDYTLAAFEWMAECGVAAVVVDVYHLDQGAVKDELGFESSSDIDDAAKLADVYGKIGHVSLAYELSADASLPEIRAVREPVFRQHLARLPPIDVSPTYARRYVTLPVVTLLRAASRMGFGNTHADDDGIARRSSPVATISGEWDGQRVPSLPLAAALEVSPAPVALGPDRIALGAAVQRLGADGTFFVNFRGQRNAYARVLASRLVEAGWDWRERKPGETYDGPKDHPQARRDALRGRIVVWGVNLAGQKDVVPTPISDQFVGPEFQATVLDNLLHGDGRVAIPAWVNAIALILALGVLGAVCGGAQRKGLGLATLLVLGSGATFGAYRAFAGGTVLDLFTPLTGLLVTYAATSAFRFMTEGRRNRWLEGTFGQYLSPAVIEALKKNPAMLELGGRQAEITVFFSDIKGFTSISERLGSENTVKVLNRYLTAQSRQVLGVDGVIDKFIGDGVMAFFGDPVPMGDHALRACRAAVRCREALAELRPLAESLGIEPIENRIGVNSGSAVVGNMGSDERFDYTAMGDTVNLASRLESANKAFGSWILLGPMTYEQSKHAIVAKPIGRLQVVGKKETVLVHELLALRDEASPETVRHADAYRRAYDRVLSDDFPGARASLDEAESERPGDGPVRWLRGLVGDLESGKRPRPWDGTVVLESK